VVLFSLLAAGSDEEASAGKGSIGCKGPVAPELPVPPTDEGGETTGDAFPTLFAEIEPMRPPAPEPAVPSTDGGGGTI
jgi:hypothetical protein